MASNSQAGAAGVAAASTAQQTFELANAITTLDPALDRIFHYNADEQRQILKEAPWRKDPHYFRRVRISAVALIKMVMHARSGGIYEVMGIMQGKIDPETRTIYVMDSYALPVQGTETRVSAANEAIEYMVQYSQLCETVGRVENAVGWYHSHPGYGCWLSGIDVDTQRNNQTHQDPFVAVVIDPNRTMSAGRVDIGAFRTYPEGYTPPADQVDGVGSGAGGTSVPQSKIEDFGVHANQYYPLEVEHFKSTLDTQLLALLWNKYWVSTLSSSSLLSNRRYEVGQIRDVADQLVRARPLIPTRSSTVAGIPLQDAPLKASSSFTDTKDHASIASTSTAGVTRSVDGVTPSNPASPEKVRISDRGSGKAHVIATGEQESTQADAASSSGDPTGEGQADAGGGESAEAAMAIHKDRVEAHLAAIKKLEAANKLTKVANDSQKITDEAEHGLLSTVLRDVLFNGHATGVPPPPPLS